MYCLRPRRILPMYISKLDLSNAFVRYVGPQIFQPPFSYVKYHDGNISVSHKLVHFALGRRLFFVLENQMTKKKRHNRWLHPTRNACHSLSGSRQKASSNLR